MPSASMTIETETTNPFSDISVALILVSANDEFMAVRGRQVAGRDAVTIEANVQVAKPTRQTVLLSVLIN